MTPIIDPRRGDVETDVSSTKSRSLLSLAGGLLAEISLPKLIMAWTLLLIVPGLLLGLAPIVASDWLRALSGSLAAATIGHLVAARHWRHRRYRLVRLAHAVSLGRDQLLVAELCGGAARLCGDPRDPAPARREPVPLFGAERSVRQASRRLGHRRRHPDLRCFPLIVYLVWPSTQFFGSLAEIGSWRELIVVALANSIVVIASYLAIAGLFWGAADSLMAQPRDLLAFDAPPEKGRSWRVVHLSDIHVVGERYGFRIESGRVGPRGNERLKRLLRRLDEIHATITAPCHSHHRRHDRCRQLGRMGRVSRRHACASGARQRAR